MSRVLEYFQFHICIYRVIQKEWENKLVRAECVRQRANDVAHSPRKGCRRALKFCIGSKVRKILGFHYKVPPTPRTMRFMGGKGGYFEKLSEGSETSEGLGEVF